MIKNIIRVYKFRNAFPGVVVPFSVAINWDRKATVEMGEQVAFGAYSELLIINNEKLSSIPSELNVGSRVFIGAFLNLRAVGGRIAIGSNVQIAQHVSIIAANHCVQSRDSKHNTALDEKKTGVEIGDGVWVGANSVLLPGITIGANSIVGAGSVVTRSIPSNQVWAGNPARMIRAL